MLNVVISGGGRTGHLYAVMLKQIEGVRVLWHTRRADVINAAMPDTGINLVDGDRVVATGRPDIVTSDISSVIGEADVVIFTQTANGRPDAVAEAVKSLPLHRPIYVGAIPGCGGFDWLMENELGKHPNVIVWAYRGVPATSPSMDTGCSVRLGGYKDKLYLGFADNAPAALRDSCAEILQRLFPQPTVRLNHFLEMTLSPLGFIHPCVLFARMGPFSQWDGQPFKERVRWWADLTELAAYFLERCDKEQQNLIRAIEKSIGVTLTGTGTLQGKVVDQYRSSISDSRTMLSTFRTCSPFQSFIPMVETPDGKGFVFKMDHPGVREDVFYGMSFLLELGRRLDVPMPYMQEIYDWSVEFLGGQQRSALEYLPNDWPNAGNALRIA